MRGLAASFVLHAVLMTAALAVLPRSERLPALFVDLTAADSSAGRRGPTPARASDPAVPRESGRRIVPPSPAPARLPEAGAATAEPSASPAAPETSAPPPPIAEPTSPVSLPSPPPAPGPVTEAALPTPPAPPPGDATPSEPEPPSAIASLNDGGGMPLEPPPLDPPPLDPHGRGGIGEAPRDDASRIGVAAAPDRRAPRPPPVENGGGGAGAGQALARPSPTSEGGEAPPAVYTAYLARLRQRVHEALRYPAAARRRGLTGAVTIELTILPGGMIRDVSVVQSSSHPLLDGAAVDAVRELRAQPFPASVPPRALRVRLPVVFQLR